MSFSSQRAVHYFIDQFNVCLLIVFIKMPEMHKRQRFDNSKSEETIVKKCQRFNKHDNEKG